MTAATEAARHKKEKDQLAREEEEGGGGVFLCGIRLRRRVGCLPRLEDSRGPRAVTEQTYRAQKGCETISVV